MILPIVIVLINHSGRFAYASGAPTPRLLTRIKELLNRESSINRKGDIMLLAQRCRGHLGHYRDLNILTENAHPHCGGHLVLGRVMITPLRTEITDDHPVPTHHSHSGNVGSCNITHLAHTTDARWKLVLVTRTNCSLINDEVRVALKMINAYSIKCTVRITTSKRAMKMRTCFSVGTPGPKHFCKMAKEHLSAASPGTPYLHNY